MTDQPQSIIGGIDTGNGYVKAALKGENDTEPDRFDIPSGVAVVTRPADVPVPDAFATTTVVDDFFNNLDASFESSLVGTTHRHLFGTRGLKAEASRFKEFDIASGLSKAEQDLSKIFILGLFAGKALKDYVLTHQQLPEDMVRVDARVALALPIDEYREHRVGLAAELLEGEHMVILRNFETPVMVKIRFEDVQVVAEGSSAQFAIRHSGVELTSAMILDLQAQGYDLPEGVTAQDVYDARNTIGIDIGEGTVNFPVYSDGQFNTDVSRTFNEGYGTVLMKSMPVLAKEGVPFKSRKKLADYLLREPAPTKRLQYETVRSVVAEQAELWCDQVMEEFSSVYSDVRYDAEVAYVFGGGSGPLKEILYAKLLEKVGTSFPVLYLDARYSRHLNRQGLFIAAEKVAAARQVPAGV